MLSSPYIFRVLLALLFIAVPVYFALRIWLRQRNNGSRNRGADFRLAIGFTRLDGWTSLALLMENKSDANVWAEEVEIVLTDLIANDQTTEASCHEIHKIRQTVQLLDMLPISLVEAIYKAAGKPQRRYSCVMSSIVRYRAGESWFETPIQPYRLKMAGLTVISNRREGWTQSAFEPQERSRHAQTLEVKSK